MYDNGELLCPMPVLRKDYDEIADRWNAPKLERCGEPLFRAVDESIALYDDGEGDGCGPTWRVECLGGHVLVIPDHEADDNYERLTYDEGTVAHALRALDRVDLSPTAAPTQSGSTQP